MATYGAAPDGGGLQELFEASPDPEVHTSAAAETTFLVGLVALLAAPFSVALGLTLATGVVALLCGVVGMATTSRPNVAGGGLNAAGLLFSFVALALVGLRYVGIDTAVGDAFAPTLHGWMESLNSWLPLP